MHFPIVLVNPYIYWIIAIMKSAASPRHIFAL